MAESEWMQFDGSSTVGRRGSENGITLRDEEHSHGARITLERDTQIAPFAITCGIYGWMVHTRFFQQEDDALREYERMKITLAAILSKSPDAAVDSHGDTQKSRVIAEIEDFVRMYP